MDDHVTDEEFSLILSELEKFREMRKDLRKKTKAIIDEETRQ